MPASFEIHTQIDKNDFLKMEINKCDIFKLIEIIYGELWCVSIETDGKMACFCFQNDVLCFHSNHNQTLVSFIANVGHLSKPRF